MRIQKISNYIFKLPNFKSNSASISATEQEKTSDAPAADASKAYATAQIAPYKELETFEIPNLGKGKMYQLSNGHKVVLIPKIGPTIINTSVKVGYMKEPAKMQEASHVLEHLLANNVSDSHNKDDIKIIAKTGDSYNAITSELLTNYYIQSPIEKPQELENIVKLQAQTLTNINFTQENLNKEKEIISAELNYRGFDKSDMLFAKQHSLQNLFNLKDEEAVPFLQRKTDAHKNLTKEDLINHYNTFYKQENMVTTVVGNIDENSINIIAKHLGKIKNTKPEQEIIPPKIPTDNPIQKTVRKDLESISSEDFRAIMMLSFVYNDNGDFENALKARVLNQLVRKKLSDYSSTSKEWFDCSSDFSEISTDKNAPKTYMLLGKSSDKNMEKHLHGIYPILFNLTQTPVSEKELYLIKTKMKHAQSVNNESVASISANCSETVQMYGSLKGNDSYLKILDSITPQDIQNTAKEIIDLNKASLVVIHPKKDPKAKELTFTGSMDAAKFEDIHEYALPNNLRVIIDSRPGVSLTTISLNLETKKPIKNNPAIKDLMDYSIHSKTFDKFIEEKGFILDSIWTPTQLNKIIYGDSDKTLEMINLLKIAMFKPMFDEKKFKEMKNILNTVNDPELEGISEKFENEFFKDLPSSKQKEDYSNLSMQDIKNCHRDFIKAAQGYVVITIPPEKLASVKQEIFNSLLQVPELQKYNYSEIFNSFKPLPLPKNKIFIKTSEKNDSINIQKNYKIINSGNISDIAGIMVLNRILGRGDKSRMFKDLREDNLLSYAPSSVYGENSDYNKIGYVRMDSTIKADQDGLRKVMEEYDNIVNNLIEKPISKEELENVKETIKSSYLNNIEDSYSRNDLLAGSYRSFYGINYHQALFEAIDKETPEHIQQIARYYLTQPSYTIISGNEKAIEANKKYLSNLGEIVE